jgi:HAD superfamily hydrolase (TIGR01549 family)
VTKHSTKVILLDIDGTLVDSNDMHTDCWVQAFAEFDKVVERDVVRAMIGKGGDLLVPDILTAREMRRFGEKLKKYRGELWKNEYMQSVQPFPGIGQALERLTDEGITLAFASSSNPNEVEYYVELLGAGKMLEATTSKGDAKFSKPSPEIFQAALEQAGGDIASTLVVGDTPYDILAGHRACMAVAAVRCGGFPPDTLTKAEFIFDDVPELVTKLAVIDEYFANE